MSSARIKTVAILLLLVVDAILGSVFVWRIANAARIETRAAEESVAALERLGLEVDVELLRRDYGELYPLEKERSLEAERLLAFALIGAEQLEPQGGGIYTAETERGRFRISNAGLFELTLYPPYPDGLSENPTAQELAALAVAAGVPGDACEVRDGAQIIDGARVFGRDISVAVGDGFISASGGLLLGEIYVTSAESSHGVVAALMTLAGRRADGDAPETVSSVELGFSAELIAENYTALRPAWRIETDAGEYYVDAVELALLE